MVLDTVARRRTIEMVRRVPIALDAAVEVLRNAPDRLIGSRFAAPWASARGLRLLAVALPGGIHIARDVRIGCGPLLEEDDAFALPVWWEAAEHPQLFPTFDGGLEVRGIDEETELRLVGSYQPPLGPIGRFANGVAGHRVVTASLETFLTGAAERLAAAAADLG